MSPLSKDKPEELFEDFKQWYKSRTFWGPVIMVLPFLLNLIGADFTVDDISESGEEAVGAVNELWNAVVMGIGALVTWWGRTKAKFRIVWPWSKKE